MTGLKDAIAQAKRRKTSLIPSPYGDGGVGDVLRGLVEEALEPIVSTLEKNIQKEFSARIDAWLQQHRSSFKGGKGDPGENAKVDLKALARSAAKYIVTPSAAEIAAYVKLPKIDEGSIVSKVIDKIGFDEDALFERLREKLLNIFIQQEKQEDFAEGVKPQEKLKISDIQGLEKFLREIMRAKRESSGDMIHGGGMTLAPGAGQTLVRNKNGTWTLTGGSAGLTPIGVTGTIDDSNTTFTPASTILLLNINGSFYQQTGGAITWNYSGSNIILSSPVGLGGSIFGI